MSAKSGWWLLAAQLISVSPITLMLITALHQPRRLPDVTVNNLTSGTVIVRPFSSRDQDAWNEWLRRRTEDASYAIPCRYVHNASGLEDALETLRLSRCYDRI